MFHVTSSQNLLRISLTTKKLQYEKGFKMISNVSLESKSFISPDLPNNGIFNIVRLV